MQISVVSLRIKYCLVSKYGLISKLHLDGTHRYVEVACSLATFGSSCAPENTMEGVLHVCGTH